MTTAVEFIDEKDMETVLGILSPKSPSNELKKRISEANKNDFGMMDYGEFRAWILKSDVHLLFRMFDIDGNGFIEPAEMLQIFQTLDESWTGEKVQQLLKEADLNRDGKISYEEFLAWAFESNRSTDDSNSKVKYDDAEKENMEGDAKDIDLLKWNSNSGKSGYTVEPSTPIRSSSRKLSFGADLTDSQKELAKRICTLDPSVSIERAQQLVENAHRSLTHVLPSEPESQPSTEASTPNTPR